MAEKRMFTKKITQSDEFLSMPHSSQNLYFHLNMEADDEGFVNSPKKVMRFINASEDDLKILLAKRFILTFESGVIVIKHWKMHNVIRPDRIKSTDYAREKAQLVIDDSGKYRVLDEILSDKCLTIDGQLTDKRPHSIEEISIDKKRIIKDKDYGEFSNVKLSDEEYQKLSDQSLLDYIERLSIYLSSTGKKYKNHYATILNWSRKDGHGKSKSDKPTSSKYGIPDDSYL